MLPLVSSVGPRLRLGWCAGNPAQDKKHDQATARAGGAGWSSERRPQARRQRPHHRIAPQLRNATGRVSHARPEVGDHRSLACEDERAHCAQHWPDGSALVNFSRRTRIRRRARFHARSRMPSRSETRTRGRTGGPTAGRSASAGSGTPRAPTLAAFKCTGCPDDGAKQTCTTNLTATLGASWCRLSSARLRFPSPRLRP